MRLWLTIAEAAPYLGDPPDAIYRAIREGDFPWEYVRLGRRIKISARSIGLIPTYWNPDGPQFKPEPYSEARSQGDTLQEDA